MSQTCPIVKSCSYNKHSLWFENMHTVNPKASFQNVWTPNIDIDFTLRAQEYLSSSGVSCTCFLRVQKIVCKNCESLLCTSTIMHTHLSIRNNFTKPMIVGLLCMALLDPLIKCALKTLQNGICISKSTGIFFTYNTYSIKSFSRIWHWFGLMVFWKLNWWFLLFSIFGEWVLWFQIDHQYALNFFLLFCISGGLEILCAVLLISTKVSLPQCVKCN